MIEIEFKILPWEAIEYQIDDFLIEPLGFCFLLIDWGPQRHFVAVPYQPCKGDAGEIFRKFRELEKFSTFRENFC